MGRKGTKFSEAEQAEILAAQKKVHPVHVTKRLLGIKLKAVNGMRSDDVGRITGLHTTSVNCIVKRYQTEGVEAIVSVCHHSEHRYI